MSFLKCLEEGSLVAFYVGVSDYVIFWPESEVCKKFYSFETQLITLGPSIHFVAKYSIHCFLKGWIKCPFTLHTFGLLLFLYPYSLAHYLNAQEVLRMCLNK